ncbi:hypothetical protein [Bradyrhizobium retamae]|nr:hypothetical protein [Bradyrhizobium retamae]
MKHHRYHVLFLPDADYIVFESFEDGYWREHMRFMIPGSQIEG